ncbi:MAG: glutamine--fructose-6-phosphate transaminase (isomerizing), partial [Clostridia bacterium]|nr:glutamine--fructose-6-phosphate transaminase (isomerizing) [Clostridia bacterium]
MCGIVGYVGNRAAVPILLQGLKTLEYRGYDSAGLAVIEDEVVKIIRSQGKIAVLEDLVGERLSEATCGIGHTRWATHGRPSDLNSHPHTDCRGEIAMVHNGIIENYLELKEFLSDKGHEFTSETDTEVLPHLVEHYYQDNLLAAVSRAIKDLRGSYATVAVCNKEPNKLVAARKDTPLIIGIGDDEYFFASDITALLEHTRKIIVMDDGEVACLTPEGYQIYRDMQPIKKEITTVTWDAESAKKGGYKHFMLKEIHEQPWALQQTLKGRIADDRSGVRLPEFSLDKIQLQRIEKVTIVACGTSYHAGLIGKYAMEKILRLPVEVDIASEFRYRDPLIDKKTLMLVISQSGETADTLAALREAKRRGAHVVAITNVLGSTISREAHDVIYTWAGPEIAVASTKAYTTQLAALYLLTMYLAEKLGRMKANELQALIEDFYRIPEKIDEIFASCEEQIKNIAEKNLKSDDAFFVGRSMDYAVAL